MVLYLLESSMRSRPSKQLIRQEKLHGAQDFSARPCEWSYDWCKVQPIKRTTGQIEQTAPSPNGAKFYEQSLCLISQF